MRSVHVTTERKLMIFKLTAAASHEQTLSLLTKNTTAASFLTLQHRVSSSHHHPLPPYSGRLTARCPCAVSNYGATPASHVWHR